MASDYREYRSRERITARVVERTIKVAVFLEGDGSTNAADSKTVNAGDYEVLAEDGTVSYQSKAEFESTNEPVRRERQAKALTVAKAKRKAVAVSPTPPAAG